MLTKDYEKDLQKFYDKLINNLEIEKNRKIENSIITEFLKTRSNKIFEVLDKSSITRNRIPASVVSELLKNGLIRNTENLNNYTITASGVWEIEKKRGIINDSILIDFIDKEFFNFYEKAEKPLTPKEKVLILSMFSARAFSEESSLDLKRKDDNVYNEWKNIIKKSCEKLKSLKLIINFDEKDLYKNPNELPVSSLFRRANELPKKTKGIYKTLGNQKYFLDIYQGNKLSKENLKYLVNLLFEDKKLTISNLEDLYSFCCDIAHNSSIYVFDTVKHIFSKPEFDEIVRESLFY